MTTDVFSLVEDQTLLQEKTLVKVILENELGLAVQRALNTPSVTPFPAKNINEAMELIKTALDDFVVRSEDTEDAKPIITYELPDIGAEFETITISLEKREPGAFGTGAPFEQKIKSRQGVLRETIHNDPNHPGYELAVIGYWYDNIVRVTCWARTNKQANERAIWVENAMEEYGWFFRYSGINRILYEGRGPSQIINVNNQKYFGRPIDYYIKTERLKVISTKELEQICVRLGIGQNLS